MVFLHWCAGIIMVYNGILFLQCAENHVVEVFLNQILAENTYFTNHIERTETRLGSYNLPLSTNSAMS